METHAIFHMFRCLDISTLGLSCELLRLKVGHCYNDFLENLSTQVSLD